MSKLLLLVLSLAVLAGNSSAADTDVEKDKDKDKDKAGNPATNPAPSVESKKQTQPPVGRRRVILGTPPDQPPALGSVVTYKDGETPLTGFLVMLRPPKAGISLPVRPGVLLVPDGDGIQESTKQWAFKLASNFGLIVFCCDMHGDGPRPLPPMDADTRQRRLRLGLEQLSRQPSANPKDVVALGIGVGGGAVLNLARSGTELRGVIALGGVPESPTPEEAAKIKARVLLVQQPEATKARREAMTVCLEKLSAAGVDCQALSMGGTPERAKTEERTWLAVSNFFTEISRSLTEGSPQAARPEQAQLLKMLRQAQEAQEAAKK